LSRSSASFRLAMLIADWDLDRVWCNFTH
jgi:hypothetical protein